MARAERTAAPTLGSDGYAARPPRRFCRNYTAYLIGCGYDPYGVATCETHEGIYTDAALEELLTCTEHPCGTAFVDCLES